MKLTLKPAFVTALIVALIVAFFIYVDPAGAAPLNGEVKPACTTSSSWLDKMLKKCVEIDPQANAPKVITFDAVKWAQALEQASKEAADYLRTHNNNNNNDPVDSSNLVKDFAWKAYCNNQTGEPQFTVTGEPVCK